MTFTPHGYQEQAIEFIQQKKRVGLLFDMGLGKTPTCLEAITRTPAMTPALIVAPLRCCYNVWPEEIEKFNFPLTYSVVHGKDKLEKLMEPTQVKITNFETLPWLVELLKEKGKIPFNSIIVDESSKIKNPFSTRFRCCNAISDGCDYRIILTGTPIPQGYMDLWPQVYFLDKGASLGKHEQYLRRFLLDRWKRPRIKTSEARRIEKSISHLMMRGDSDELLDMPDLIEDTVHLSMTDAHAKRYDEVEYGFLNGMDNFEEFTEANYAPLRLCASGALYHTMFPSEDGDLKAPARITERISDHKIEAVKEIQEGIGGKPLLVAFNFRAEREALVREFGCPYIDGSVSSDYATDVVRRWNDREYPVLAVQPMSVGFGLNMQRGGQHMIWYSLPDSGELYEQTVGRLHRQGQKGRVFVYKLITKNTIEENMDGLLRRKILTQENLLNEMKGNAKDT